MILRLMGNMLHFGATTGRNLGFRPSNHGPPSRLLDGREGRGQGIDEYAQLRHLQPMGGKDDLQRTRWVVVLPEHAQKTSLRQMLGYFHLADADDAKSRKGCLDERPAVVDDESRAKIHLRRLIALRE